MKKNFLKDEIVSSNELKSLELWHDSNFDTGRERLIQNNLIFTGLFFSRIFFLCYYLYLFFRWSFGVVLYEIFTVGMFSHICYTNGVEIPKTKICLF